MTSPTFTTAEKAARIKAVYGHLRAADGSTKHLDRLDAINDKARDRAAKELAAWQVEYEEATAVLAAARVEERAADRHQRKAAKQRVKDAEGRVKRLERSKPKR